ncbi:GGDEF domain-containing protein [Kosakonia radicincitans]|uniref:GGDEF domain-containing protein n=1 Tax=Kosakonia radicincitans TaxID=283686 RepID=UPI0008C6835A|nr:GGDEF domain-containing protein [Kosakonia radicincitans]MDD7996719.1 diguanylate cyclase [Kosakonia radicincitans]QEM89254.1 GGDEF domain-containing protein [Kosakonia radicincitans]SET38646.1 diguanylate cyclase (GGDEF) domain-containing protein [Kosakonia radicincitans]SKC12855.1 diguanylate cyclase (GGDEF) domain-containing protein [Kosakonia radicincitans]
MKDKLLLDAFSALSLGVIIVDAQYRITLWNAWLEAHTGLAASETLGEDFFTVFPDLQYHRVGDAIRQAIGHNLSALLSQSLHRSPFPLYAEPARPAARLSQAVTIVPLGDAERFCLIQIVDVTAAVRRESLLRDQAHELLSQSLSDGLTGVGNRRYFDLCIDREWRASKRNNKSLSLLLIDVDHFKRYNDCYGHQRGDECLQQIATAMRNALDRPNDILFRYGGEEFCALLPETRSADAVEIAERLRTSVQLLDLPHANSPDRIVSVSIGVASLNQQQHTEYGQLIQSADDALYVAKRAGRNTVRVKSATRQSQPVKS